jgi:hypothetical protein
MNNLDKLIQMAEAKCESKANQQEDAFDELDNFSSNLVNQQIPQTYGVEGDMSLAMGGNSLRVGDLVTGIHKGRNMGGTVVSIEDNDKAIVYWKDGEKTRIPLNKLTLTDVDDDDLVEEVYIESVQPTMGFDKQAFTESTDFNSLLVDTNSIAASGNYGDL